MAKLTSFSVSGMQLWFHSHDHNPPHFHARKKGAWEVRVYFQLNEEEMFDMVSWEGKKTISAKDRRTLVALVETHRLELLREWETKVNVQ